jgi:hypothetical protein
VGPFIEASIVLLDPSRVNEVFGRVVVEVGIQMAFKHWSEHEASWSKLPGPRPSILDHFQNRHLKCGNAEGRAILGLGLTSICN